MRRHQPSLPRAAEATSLASPRRPHLLSARLLWWTLYLAGRPSPSAVLLDTLSNTQLFMRCVAKRLACSGVVFLCEQAGLESSAVGMMLPTGNDGRNARKHFCQMAI